MIKESLLMTGSIKTILLIIPLLFRVKKDTKVITKTLRIKNTVLIIIVVLIVVSALC